MRIKTTRAVDVLVAVLVMAGVAGSGIMITASPAASAMRTLTSVRVTVAPTLDGSGGDAAWLTAPAARIPVQTFGTRPFVITLKSVHDTRTVYFLVQYPDGNMDVERNPWVFNAEKKAWERLADDFGDEDEFGFFWNINIANYARTGCAVTCHGDKMIAPKGQMADDWRWNAARSNPMGWARDFHLTDDAKAEPAGGFTKDEGYTANRGYVDNVQKLDALEVPLYWKPYSGAGGVAVGDPRFLLQREIDAGLARKIVKIDAGSILIDAAGNRVPLFARIPGRILSAPGGPSWNNIKARGAWLDGVWTVELARALKTGFADDVQFELGKTYYFDMYIKTRQPGESAHAQVPVTRFVFKR